MKRFISKFFITTTLLITSLQFTSLNTFAAVIGGASGISGSTPDPIFTIPKLGGYNNLGDLISALIALAYFVAGVAFFFMLIIGGIQWISAGGDPKALDGARKRITNAVIGLVIVVAAYAITVIVGQVFGISITKGFKFK